jgi:5-formyltetrahydrofolate cyclo-ligase
VSSDLNPIKTQLRLVHRERRKSQDAVQRAGLDSRLNHLLLHHYNEQGKGAWGEGSVLAFWPNDGEPDLRPALTALSQAGVQIGLPVIEPRNDGRMRFHAWRPDGLMTPNRFGIPEPLQGRPCPLSDAAVVLMPLVAFDRQGGRLGMGGGFYDRALGHLKDAAVPQRIGVAYAIQEETGLPREPWDVSLHGVLTEDGWFTFPC